MQAQGLSACAKHFPGLGAATLDPHLDLPTLAMTWKQLRKKHLQPFLAALRAGVDCVMSSHPVYPNLDSSKRPATFSRKIIYDFLRRELDFRGVILSDDLEMGALRGLCDIGEAAVRAVEAGHDMVLLCHNPTVQREAYKSLLSAYESGRLNTDYLQKSFQRISKLLAKRKRRFVENNSKPSQGKILAREIAKKGIRVEGKLNRLPGKVKPLVIFPRLWELSEKFYIEKEMKQPQKFISNLLSRKGLRPASIKILSLHPKPAELKSVIGLTEKSDHTIFFCYDAHLDAGCRQVLKSLISSRKGTVILLRDPYDAQFIKKKLLTITAYGFRKVQIEAATEKLVQILKS